MSDAMVAVLCVIFVMGTGTLVLCPWLIERNTPEQQILLKMLATAAAEPNEWLRVENGALQHGPTGIIVSKALPSFEEPKHASRVIINSRTIDYDSDTRGYNIVVRLFAAFAAQETKIADLETLKVLTAQFRKDWSQLGQ